MFIMKKSLKKFIILCSITLAITPNITHAATCRGSYADDSYCRAHDYQLIGNTGCTAGTCIFPDGSSCLSTDFYEGTCGKEFRKELACTKNGERVPAYSECCSGKKIFQTGPGGHATWTTCENYPVYYFTQLLRAWRLILFAILLFSAFFAVYATRKKKKIKSEDSL